MDKWSAVNYWRKAEPSFVPDLDVPGCFACGYAKFKHWSETDDPRIIRARWERSRHLDCAHIIAASIGGRATVSNILLLCRRCHLESPMTNRREVMLDWVRHRPPILNYWVREIQASIGNVPEGVNLAEIVPFIKRMQADRHPMLPPGTLASGYLLALREFVATQPGQFSLPLNYCNHVE